MEWKIEIKNRSSVKKDFNDLGIVGIKKASTAQVFVISGTAFKKRIGL